jgi:renalase
MKNVLVIGTGITGASLAHYIAKASAPANVRLTFWEKSRGPGGRVSTVRSREPGSAIVDHGAQYITRGVGGAAADETLYAELISHGIIHPFTGVVEGSRPEHQTQEHFVCRNGMSTIAQHLLDSAKATVEYERRALELTAADAQSGSRALPQWRVTDTAGESALFDAVVVTIPTPQLLELEGAGLRALLEPHRAALSRVASRYSMRYAVCAYYDQNAWAALEALPWTSKYVRGGESGTEGLVYVSVEPRKRSPATSSTSAASPPALLLHSSVPYGIKHANDAPDAVLSTLLADVAKLVPGLPPPVRTKLHRWRYSQVPPADKELAGANGLVPGAEDGALLLGGPRHTTRTPPLIIAGDGLIGSNFDNCAASARAASAALLASLSNE